MAGESHAFALNATIPYDSFESSSILLRGDFVPAPRNGGEQMLHNPSLKSGGADMLLVLPCCGIGACTGELGLRRTPRCWLLPIQFLPMNIGDMIGGLESVDIPYGLRKTAAEARCVRPSPAVWKKKSAYR